MKYYIALACFCLSLSNSLAQNNPENKLGFWSTYSGTHMISEKTSVNICAQVWLYEVSNNFNLALINAGLSYYISPKLVTTISYGYGNIDSSFDKNGSHIFENRVYEQIAYNHNIKKLPINYRFRIEQRFLNGPESNKTKHRLRFRLGTKIKLSKTLFVRFYDEFLNTLKKDAGAENRLYGALGINISKSNNLQLGYLNQKLNGLNLHRLQVGYFIKANHFKKKKS